MNKVILQLWEESNTKEGFLSDGCSLHLSVKERDIYVSSIYNSRDNSIIPNEYDRLSGWLGCQQGADQERKRHSNPFCL